MATCFKRLAGWTLLFVMATCLQAAEDEGANPGAPADAARIAELVKLLDHEDFATREEAAKNLLAAGPSAAPLVAQAAAGESLEAAMRAIAILDKWFTGWDLAYKQAAEQELVKLAAGSEETSARRRAKALLSNERRASYDLFGTPAAPAVDFAVVLPEWEVVPVGEIVFIVDDALLVMPEKAPHEVKLAAVLDKSLLQDDIPAHAKKTIEAELKAIQQADKNKQKPPRGEAKEALAKPAATNRRAE